MNREIKFRAWVKGKMILPEYADKEDFSILADGTPVEINEYGHEGYQFTSRIEAELMQFTSLQDKNGKDIYEGDVLRCTDPDNEQATVFPVEFNDGGYSVEWLGMFNHGEADLMLIAWASKQDFSFEIIGNIYDNPELNNKS